MCSVLQVLLIGVGRHSLCHFLYRLFRILYHLCRWLSWLTWFELGLASVWTCSGWISILGNEWKQIQLAIWLNPVTELLLFRRRLYQWVGLEGSSSLSTLFLVNNSYDSLMHISTILQTRENSNISSSSVDTNNEDWTGWFVWQPGIDGVKDQITSFRTLLPTARSRLSIFQTISTTKLNCIGKKNLRQIRINRVLAIRLYKKLGSFYRPNPNTVFI